MIPQTIIDLLNLQPVKDPGLYFPFECYLWENELGTCKVQDCDLRGHPLRDGFIAVLAHGNGGIAWITVAIEMLMDVELTRDFVLRILRTELNKNKPS